jgi:putative membrane protein
VEIVMSLQTIGSFLIYFVAALIATAIFIVVYMAVTSHHEVSLIKQGNTAAAVSFAGALLGFTLPLASAIVNAVSLVDMLVWSAIALVVQIVVFLVVDRLLRQVSRQIEDGNVAAGITLAAASLAIGMINAASMTY